MITEAPLCIRFIWNVYHPFFVEVLKNLDIQETRLNSIVSRYVYN